LFFDSERIGSDEEQERWVVKGTADVKELLILSMFMNACQRDYLSPLSPFLVLYRDKRGSATATALFFLAVNLFAKIPRTKNLHARYQAT